MFCLLYHPTLRSSVLFFFFFNDTSTTEIYTLSLHDALPIFSPIVNDVEHPGNCAAPIVRYERWCQDLRLRSEEHTSELQSHHDLVCRLLLEKKKKKNND